ncbi:TrmB family transcriptional regulator [candidate division KSB1 bacterium]
MPEKPDIIALLESLGLSKYEAKAYSGLLSQNPVTGYQLSKVSGVPRSRIYETLEKLFAKGLVSVQDSEPKFYSPIDIEEFFNKVKLDVMTNMKKLRAELEGQETTWERLKGVWNIEGRKNILAKADYMIRKAESSILICAWADDLNELQLPLGEVLNNSKSVNIIYFGNFDTEGFENTYQQYKDPNLKDTCRDLTLIVDKNYLLTGSTMPIESCLAFHTQEPALVYIAREYLMQKVALGKMTGSIPDDIKKAFDSFYNIHGK